MSKFLSLCFLMVFFLTGYCQNRRSTSSSPTSKTETKKDESKSEEPSKKTKKASGEAPKEENSNSSESQPVSKEYTGKPWLNPQSDISGMSTVIEFGATPSDADITTINLYGHLGLNFDIARRFHFGPYFRHKILSTHAYQVIPYKGIDYDVSSLKEWGSGICFGGYFPLGSALLLDPELRIGYNEFTIQHPQYSDVTTNFIYRNYINFTPRLNLGFKLSDYTIFNLHGGYTLPYYLNNPESVPHYNPSGFHYGIGLRFYLSK